MKKILLLPMIMAVCALDSGAFGAQPRGRTTSANNAPAANNVTQKPATTAARSAARGVNAPVKQNAGNAASLKLGSDSNATSGASKNGTPNASKGTSGQGVGTRSNSARAAATQKVIQTGSKVSTATQNTAIPQECQDAFFGCMDSFCMLDNASGGRCQCSDRISDLDKALEEIMKLDERTYIMATEGVERIQMGEAAEQIMARAQAAANNITVKDGVVIGGQSGSTTTTSSKKITTSVPKLDLSAWGKSIYDDDDEDEDDIFGDGSSSSNAELVETFANKKGDELYKSAATMCVKAVPDTCKQYGSMVQLVYAQKIRSDCTAYENSLKKQKNESQQKLLAAEKALRDAALQEFNDQNKYGTEGECVQAFDKCMQVDAGCGSDYTTCLADDTILTMGTDGSKGAATTASVETAASTIGISANTLAILTEKGKICEKVLKQCQNVRKGVWNTYLKMIVPTLKTAEVAAEEQRRMNCVGNIVDCYAKACAAKWPDQESAEYDMCLSNPDIVSNLCQTQINKCSTSGTGEQVMEYVKAKLQALRVDACTKEVKDCLTNENNCGEGFINCIGLDTDTIVKMCTNSATNFKLMACQSKFNNNQYEVQNYVAQVAQGLILNIDNAALKSCEEAAEKSMKAFCGATETCNSETVSNNVSFTTADLLTAGFKYQFCPVDKQGDFNTSKCLSNAGLLTYNDVERQTWKAKMLGQINFNCFEFVNGSVDMASNQMLSVADGENKNAGAMSYEMPHFRVVSASENPACAFGQNGIVSEEDATKIAGILTQKVRKILAKVEANSTIQRCMKGRDIKGISTFTDIPDGEKDAKTYEDVWTMSSSAGIGKGAFPNLMTQYRDIIADAVLASAELKYGEDYDSYVEANESTAENELKSRINKIKSEAASVEAANKLTDSLNSRDCSSLQYLGADRAIALVKQNGYSNEHPRYYDAISGTIKTKSTNQLWKNGLIGGARGEYVNNITTTYDTKNNQCKIVTQAYKCKNFKYASIHKCRDGYEKDGNATTEYKKYTADKKVESTRYYN